MYTNCTLIVFKIQKYSTPSSITRYITAYFIQEILKNL